MTSLDTSRYALSLLLSQPLREPIIKNIIRFMQLPGGSSGLDLGCGLGFNTLLLAEALGPQGTVIGLDAEEEFLTTARSLFSNCPIKERINFVKGDVKYLTFPHQSFDWACSIDCVGTLAADPVMLLREISRVIKPGGRIFIIVWSSQILLPGFPLLEARLNASTAGIAPFVAGMAPERHIMRALGWFNQASFTDTRAQTFARDIAPPLSTEIIAAMTDLFTMRWGSIEKEVAPELWQDYQRLCNPDSPDFILELPDYYAFFTYSVFSGRVQ